MNVTHRLIATHDVIACTPICTPVSVRNGPSATTIVPADLLSCYYSEYNEDLIFCAALSLYT